MYLVIEAPQHNASAPHIRARLSRAPATIPAGMTIAEYRRTRPQRHAHHPIVREIIARLFTR
jgi:hypothetical protein